MKKESFSFTGLRQYAQNLLYQVGPQATCSALFALGSVYGAKAGKLVEEKQWKVAGEQFLLGLGLLEPQFQIVYSKDKNQTFYARVLWQMASFQPGNVWLAHYLAGWCSGFSTKVYKNKIIFQIRRQPCEGNSIGLLEGRSQALNILEDWPFIMRSQNPKIKKVAEQILDISQQIEPVFIYGERGSGKEIFARFLHSCSVLAKAPIALLPASTVNQALLFEVLEGQKRGSTVITDFEGLTKELQKKIINYFISQSKNRRLILCSEMPLPNLYKNDGIHPDLYAACKYRTVHIPPLRDHVEDIVLLLKQFSLEFSPQSVVEFSPALISEFIHYAWPGNIAELKSVAQRMISKKTKQKTVLDIEDIPMEIRTQRILSYSTGEHSLAAVEKRAIFQVLELVQGNKVHAAKRLGIGYNTLWRKLKEYRIEN